MKYINGFIKDKCNIIVTVGFLMADATWNAAVANPQDPLRDRGQHERQPRGPGRPVDPCPGAHCKKAASNLLGLTYDTNQDGFLGGYEAAATSKTGTLSRLYGGEQFSSVTIYMDGFAQGIAYYNAAPQGGRQDGDRPRMERDDPDRRLHRQLHRPASAATRSTNTFLNARVDRIFPVAGWRRPRHDRSGQDLELRHPSPRRTSSGLTRRLHRTTRPTARSSSRASPRASRPRSRQPCSCQATGKFKGGNYVGTLKNGGAALRREQEVQAGGPGGADSEDQVADDSHREGHTIKVKT